jgi:regulatory protein
MSVITRLATARSRDKRINIYLDGKYTFSLPADIVIREGLKTDQELSASRLKSLAAADRQSRCFNAALRYIGYRPRSEYEVRQRLQRRGFEGDCIEKVVANLKEQGYINDDYFARFWKENRQDFSPRSRRMTRMELQRKGIDGELIERVTGEVDDKDSTYRAACIKARRLPKSDYQLFSRRLGEHLRRRGFGYEVIKQTINRVWRECGADSAENSK